MAGDGNGPHAPLQRFGFRDSAYDRPGREWVCGHAGDGFECAIV